MVIFTEFYRLTNSERNNAEVVALGGESGRSLGGSPHPLILSKTKNIAEGRKTGRASKRTAPLLGLGLDPPMRPH